MAARSRHLFRRVLRGDTIPWSAVRQRLFFEIKRPYRRAIFRFTSGGKDLDRLDPLHLSFMRTVGRRVVNADMFSANPATAVVLGIGQSNMANEGDPTALYQPKGEVYNFNFFDGRCYAAKDPLLGASIDRSNVLTRIGDLLFERGNYRRVLLVPIAHGGTGVQDWSPDGRMFPRLDLTLEMLKERQIRITHVAWQQGESEAYKPNPDAEVWMHHFMAMVRAIRTADVDAPIYVAQSTICCCDANETIRSAQHRVVNPAAGILPGPDIDLIGRDERYDDCHLSATGLRRAAELWYEALCCRNP
jgi:Carbohydrate esterase, sialic acid-specific acetylesterase